MKSKSNYFPHTLSLLSLLFVGGCAPDELGRSAPNRQSSVQGSNDNGVPSESITANPSPGNNPRMVEADARGEIFVRAGRALREGNIAGAKDLAQSVNDPSGWGSAILGEVAFYQGDMQKVVLHYRRALELCSYGSSCTTAQFARYARACEQLNQPAEATRLYRKAYYRLTNSGLRDAPFVEQDLPDNEIKARMLIRAGQELVQTGFPRYALEAQAYVERGYSVSSNSPTVRYWYAIYVAKQRKKYNEAIGLLESIRDNPDAHAMFRKNAPHYIYEFTCQRDMEEQN